MWVWLLDFNGKLGRYLSMDEKGLVELLVKKSTQIS